PEAGNDASVPTMSDKEIDRVAFLPDGKALLALIAPAIWLIWQRLWLVLALYVLAMAALAALIEFGNPELGSFLSVLPGLFLFLEGREMVHRRYERQGWRFDRVIEAGDEKIAELRYFSEQDYAPTPAKSDKSDRPAVPLFAKPIKQVAPFGLFPE
ncbi:MAG: DUF2628 domain-containing protein, partial [Rhizobiaceae bacterium]|nr:DUF2628 domain-containing protein [Rhizobiaceae bacterium]